MELGRINKFRDLFLSLHDSVYSDSCASCSLHMPTKEHGFVLQEGTVCLAYFLCWIYHLCLWIYVQCKCMLIKHALNAKCGGFLSLRHNEITFYSDCPSCHSKSYATVLK